MFAFHLKPESDRLKIRDLRNTDNHRLFQIYSDKEAMKFRGSEPMLYIDDAQKMINESETKTSTCSKKRLAIIQKTDNTLIGTILIQQEKDALHKVEIGYSLDKLYWNKGYATEVVQLLIRHLKALDEIEELVAWCAKENKASAKVLLKNGFQEESQNKHLQSSFFKRKVR